MKKNNKLGYVIFLVSPLLALIHAFRHLDNKYSKNVIWFFCAFMGYCFHISEDYSGDAARYADKLSSYIIEGTKVNEIISNLFSNSAHIEVVEELISITVSNFSSDYHVLFLVYGLVFGYFFSRNIVYIYEITKRSKKKGLEWIILVLFFTLPPWGINGFPFWTACQIFIFAVLPYIIDKNKKRLLFIVLAPLTHFSFYIPVLVTFLFFTLKLKKNLVFYFYCFSFLFTGVDSATIGKLFIDFVPDIFVPKFITYTQEIDLSTKEGGKIMGALNKLYTYAISIFFIVSYKRNEKFIRSNKMLNQLFQYGFYFVGVFNILSIIPSVSRYLAIGKWVLWVSIAYLVILLNYIESHIVLNNLRKVQPFILMFCLITTIRYLFPILGIEYFFSGPLISVFFEGDDFVIGNIIELIK